MYRHSLARPLLSRFLTPADTSQCSRFFRVWRLFRLPGSNRSPGLLQSGYDKLPSFSAADGRKRLWLCPSRPLLRESQLRGGMYRHNPRVITAFAGSEPRLTSRNAVGFFGSGGCCSSLNRTDHSAYFGAATYLLPDSVRCTTLKQCPATIIPLGRTSRCGSSNLPEGSDGPGQPSPPIWSCTTRGLPCQRHY